MEECLAKTLFKKHFTANQHGLHLNKHGKAFIIPLFNQYMLRGRKFNELNTNHKNHIYQFAGLLAKRIRTFETK